MILYKVVTDKKNINVKVTLNKNYCNLLTHYRLKKYIIHGY
jgi:hypothetical protein